MTLFVFYLFSDTQYGKTDRNGKNQTAAPVIINMDSADNKDSSHVGTSHLLSGKSGK